jgi:hypothetical protein
MAVKVLITLIGLRGLICPLISLIGGIELDERKLRKKIYETHMDGKAVSQWKVSFLSLFFLS